MIDELAQYNKGISRNDRRYIDEDDIAILKETAERYHNGKTNKIMLYRIIKHCIKGRKELQKEVYEDITGQEIEELYSDIPRKGEIIQPCRDYMGQDFLTTPSQVQKV